MRPSIDDLNSVYPPQPGTNGPQMGRGKVSRLTDGDTLAEALGIGRRYVATLAAEGVVRKVARDSYDWVASVKAFMEKSKKSDTGVKDRLTLAQAELAELKLAEGRGELVKASQVELEWDATLRGIRASIMGIPARVQSQLSHLSAHDVDTLDRALRDTLTELGNDNANA